MISTTDTFIYDESSPSCLKWKNNRMAGKDYTVVVKRSGENAGTLNIVNKMWHVQFRGGPKPAHRIIWEMFNNETDVVVTFLNGDTSDCRLSNLQARKAITKSVASLAAESKDWNSIFEFDNDGFLVWKIDNYTGHRGNVLKAKVGDRVATHKDTAGYTVVSLGTTKGGAKKLHNIVYEMHNGTLKDGEIIDHIDGNIDNNSPSNLRVASTLINARNRKIASHNTTGVTGVSLKKCEKSGDSYRAAWRTICGKGRERSFSVRKYGKDEAFRLACNYRAKMIEELNLQGAGYTERHGT